MGEKKLASKIPLMFKYHICINEQSEGLEELLAGSPACDCLSLFLIKMPMEVSEKLNDT